MVLRQVNKRLFLVLLSFVCMAFFSTTDTYAQTKRPSVGLVLSGGGAKGLAHIGVLKVIEELGIPIDYVGGTSMGSVVGGLYAIGYSASEIEQMTIEQDWVALLTDQIERNNLSVYEKDDYDKYLISFPFDSLRIKLPSGLGAGQNISMLLSKMALPVANIDNFDDFPRPFLCVATDIVSGAEVVLRSGYLPDAIRASMAIPTIFTPVEIDNYYLVDGGLQNNFPVDRVKAMGADIIIGVNLGLKEYSKKELENLATVLEQSLFFHAKERNIKNQALCDVLLSPNVYKSNAASFSNVRDLIKIGEDNAWQHEAELRALVDSFNLEENESDFVHSKIVDSIYVRTIEYLGLKNVSQSFLEGKVRLKIPGKVAINDLENGIERAYGTQFFKKITYRTEFEHSDSVNLIFRVEEESSDLVRLGVRYDSYFKAQLLLNTTFRNKIVKGSKLSLDLYLGLYPRFRTEYRINTGWKEPKMKFFSSPGRIGLLPDFGGRFEMRTIDIQQYDKTKLIGVYNYQYFTLTGFFSAIISNPLYLEMGAEYDFSFLESVINIEEEPIENQSLAVYTKLVFDSYDDQVIPTEGAFMEFWTDVIRDYNIPSNTFVNLYRAGMRLEKVAPLTKNISVLPYAKVGIALGDTIPPLRRMFLGGNMLHTKMASNLFSFSGLRFLERNENCVYALGAKLRLNAFKVHYLTIDNVFGRTERTPYELFSTTANYLYGFGLTYGFDSLVGPFEIGVFKSNQSIPWQLFINFGYWF